MHKLQYWFVISFFILLTIGISFFGNSIDLIRQPQGTMYSFTYGHTGDYYQFLYYISQGMKGKFLYNIPYSPVETYPMIIVPVYFWAGFLLKFITSSPILVMQLIRIVTLIIFWLTIGLLIQKSVISLWSRITACVLFFFSGAFWTLDYAISYTQYYFPMEGIDHFHVIKKFLVASNLIHAIICLMLFIILWASSLRSNAKILLGSILMIIGGFSHPYIMPIILAILWSQELGRIFISRTIIIKNIFLLIVVTTPALGIYYYYYVTTPLVFPFRTIENNLFSLTIAPISHIKAYMLSLGIPLVTSLLSLFSIKKFKNRPLFWMLWVWVTIPILGIVFQAGAIIHSIKSYQYIPFSILTAIGIESLISLNRRFRILIPITIIIIVVYSVGPIIQFGSVLIDADYRNNYTVYIPEFLTEAFDFLNKNTPEKSIVVAPEALSFMIPVFTHNKVIIGQGSSRDNYDWTVNQVNNFYAGRLSEEESLYFLDTNQVNYIIFNVGVEKFRYPFDNYRRLKRVSLSMPVEIIQVVNN